MREHRHPDRVLLVAAVAVLAHLRESRLQPVDQRLAVGRPAVRVAHRADAELDAYLEGYYLRPAAEIRTQQYTFAGDRAAAVGWLGEFVEGGASHVCVRFTGSDDARQMEELVRIREELA